VSTRKALNVLLEKLAVLNDEIKNLIFKGIISVVCMLCLSAFTAVSLTALYYQPKINDLNETRDKLEPEIQINNYKTLLIHPSAKLCSIEVFKGS
jgi:hypothetical protein